MKTWIISICFVILLTTLFTMILPNGKTAKIIRRIFSLISMLTIISPVLNFNNIDFNLLFNDTIADVEIQSSFLEYNASNKVDNLKYYCENTLKENGIDKVKVDILYQLEKSGEINIKIVKLNLKNAVIISDNLNIDIIDYIKEVSASCLGVEINKIELYG